MFTHQLAHSEDLHQATTSDLEHYLKEPLVALPVYLGLLLLIYLLTSKFTKLKKPSLVILYLFIFFVVGVGFYSVVPIISFISLIAGMGLSIFFAFSLIVSV